MHTNYHLALRPRSTYLAIVEFFAASLEICRGHRHASLNILVHFTLFGAAVVLQVPFVLRGQKIDVFSKSNDLLVPGLAVVMGSVKFTGHGLEGDGGDDGGGVMGAWLGWRG